VQQIDYMSGQHTKSGRAAWPIYFDPKINDRMSSLSRGAVFIDPLKHLCDGRLCPYRDGDHFYFADYGHFSTYGSDLAVRSYFPPGGPMPAGS